MLRRHPCRYSLPLELLKGNGEGTVTLETTLVGQLLGCNGLLCRQCITVKLFEMGDAQTVDVGIIANTLLGEVGAQISTVGTNSLTELCQCQVMEQIKFRYGTNEVWISVIATTLVIAAVFIPLTMLKGMAGILFKELGWIVTIVVSTSTVVAITLTPMLASKLLKPRKVAVDEKGQLIDMAEVLCAHDPC